MKHARMAIVALGVSGIALLTACPGRDAGTSGQGGSERQSRFPDLDASCKRAEEGTPRRTRLIVDISVAGGAVHVSPDPVRAFPGDVIAWRLSAPAGEEGAPTGWKVTYKDETPLARTAGGDTAGVAMDSVTGRPRGIGSRDGRLAVGEISASARCRPYEYDVEVTLPGGGTLSADPDNDIIPPM